MFIVMQSCHVALSVIVFEECIKGERNECFYKQRFGAENEITNGSLFELLILNIMSPARILGRQMSGDFLRTVRYLNFKNRAFVSAAPLVCKSEIRRFIGDTSEPDRRRNRSVLGSKAGKKSSFVVKE